MTNLNYVNKCLYDEIIEVDPFYFVIEDDKHNSINQIINHNIQYRHSIPF